MTEQVDTGNIAGDTSVDGVCVVVATSAVGGIIDHVMTQVAAIDLKGTTERGGRFFSVTKSSVRVMEEQAWSDVLVYVERWDGQHTDMDTNPTAYTMMTQHKIIQHNTKKYNTTQHNTKQKTRQNKTKQNKTK